VIVKAAPEDLPDCLTVPPINSDPVTDSPRMHNRQPLDPPHDRTPSQLKTLWKNISNDLRVQLGDSTFDLWFGNFQLTEVSAEEVVLVAPGTMYAIWVEEKF